MSTDRTLAELVLERPAAARVFARLGLDYCCGGGDNLEDVCRARGLDARTVLVFLEHEREPVAEKRELFPLLTAGAVDRSRVERLLHEHDATGARLRRLRELGGDYVAETALCATHRALLDGLNGLELDLHQHVHEENNILFPRALAESA